MRSFSNRSQRIAQDQGQCPSHITDRGPYVGSASKPRDLRHLLQAVRPARDALIHAPCLQCHAVWMLRHEPEWSHYLNERRARRQPFCGGGRGRVAGANSGHRLQASPPHVSSTNIGKHGTSKAVTTRFFNFRGKACRELVGK